MANIPGTNIPAIAWSNGFPIIPSGPDVLVGVQADISAAFGRTLNFNLNTPQAQLASSETAVVDNTNQNFAYYVQQVDPAYATGRMQDAIGRVTFQTRLPALPTALQVICSGLGAVIPAGALVQDSAKNLYAATVGGTIPNAGSITLEFDCTIPGPVTLPSGALTIYQTIPGWDSATVASGVTGRAVENSAAFEARRRATVAANAIGSLPAIRGSVLNVAGVTDAYVIDNPTAAPVTTLGVSVAAKSVYVAAVGGADLNVATAIWRKKAPGCGYTGNTTVTVQDSQSGYLPPFPSYNVTFQRPTALQVLFKVDLVSTPQVPANAATLVQGAIAAAAVASGTPTFLQIGGLVLASNYLASIFALGSWVQVRSILVGSNDAPDASFTASIAGALMTVTAVGTGALAANQWVFGIGVAGGTKIVSQASGSPGSTGTYNLDTSQTLTSRAMTGSAADSSSLQVLANEAPQTSAPYILVTVT